MLFPVFKKVKNHCFRLSEHVEYCHWRIFATVNLHESRANSCSVSFSLVCFNFIAQKYNSGNYILRTMVRKRKTKEIQIDRTHSMVIDVRDEGILRIAGERNVNQRLTQISRGGDVSLAAEARLTLFE